MAAVIDNLLDAKQACLRFRVYLIPRNRQNFVLIFIRALKTFLSDSMIIAVSYTHLDVYKRQESMLLKFIPGLFGRGPLFSTKTDISAVPPTAIISDSSQWQ